MRNWLKTTLFAWLVMGVCPTANAQIWFKLDLLQDDLTYQVSMVSDTTWVFPYNLTSSAQITLRVPHGDLPYKFSVNNLQSLQPGSEWDANVYISAPEEAPSWDYISIGLVSLGTDAFSYEKGEELPLFSFTNGGASCVDSIELVHPANDPFSPPNSQGVNIGHSIVTFGGGLGGSFSGIIGTGRAPCTPILNCDPILTEHTLELCEGEAVLGFSPLNDTLLQQHYIASNGCDSLVETSVTVFKNQVLAQATTVCLGGTYAGEVFYQDTTLIENLTSIHGCDSSQVTHLSVLQHSITNIDTMLCYGEFYQGISPFQDTTIYNVLTAANGCDSIVTSFIEVSPFNYLSKDTTVCEGTVFGGEMFEENGWLEENWTNINGCDSFTIRTNVWVVPHSENVLSEVLVAGDTWNGVSYFTDTTLIDILENEQGCDSILTVHLNVFPPDTHLSDTTICEGQILEGQTFYNDTLLVDTLPGLGLLVTEVSVVPTTVVQMDTTICEGTVLGGMAHYADTTLTTVFNGISVCDSVVVTQVQVLAEQSSMQSASVCFGEPFEGILYTVDTLLVEMLQSAAGCDSLVYTDLRVIPEKKGYTEAAVCEGEAFNGAFFQHDTILFEILTAADGCDSLLEIQLKVNPVPTPVISGETEFCEGETIPLATGSYMAYEWGTGENSSTINVSASGVYGLTVTDANGCQGSTSFETKSISLSADVRALNIGCNDNQHGTIVYENTEGGIPPYLFSIDGGASFEVDSVFEGLAPGTYELVVQDVNGCQWNEELNAIYENLFVTAPDDILLDLGDSARLFLQMNFSEYDTIIWSSPTGLSCSDCPAPFARPTVTTNYQIKVVTPSGCELEDDVTIYVAQKSKVYLPTAFSPNDDGVNDRFYPFGGPDVKEIKSIQVFDRYGSLLFEQRSFPPNDPVFGWTGESHAPGTYVYMVIAEFINGREALLKGEVQLMK